jgi:hypothetical protein
LGWLDYRSGTALLDRIAKAGFLKIMHGSKYESSRQARSCFRPFSRSTTLARTSRPPGLLSTGWRSVFFASACSPFIYFNSRVLLDAAQDLSGEDVEGVARDLHVMPAPRDENVAPQTYYAVMRCASHSKTLSCLRMALLLWHILAPFGRADD